MSTVPKALTRKIQDGAQGVPLKDIFDKFN